MALEVCVTLDCPGSPGIKGVLGFPGVQGVRPVGDLKASPFIWPVQPYLMKFQRINILRFDFRLAAACTD